MYTLQSRTYPDYAVERAKREEEREDALRLEPERAGNDVLPDEPPGHPATALGVIIGTGKLETAHNAA